MIKAYKKYSNFTSTLSRRSAPGETEKERLLFCYQISQQIVEGRFPLNKVLAFELAALMAQVRYIKYYILLYISINLGPVRVIIGSVIQFRS